MDPLYKVIRVIWFHFLTLDKLMAMSFSVSKENTLEKIIKWAPCIEKSYSTLSKLDIFSAQLNLFLKGNSTSNIIMNLHSKYLNSLILHKNCFSKLLIYLDDKLESIFLGV